MINSYLSDYLRFVKRSTVDRLRTHRVLALAFALKSRLLPDNSFQRAIYCRFVQPFIRRSVDAALAPFAKQTATITPPKKLRIVTPVESKRALEEVTTILVIKLDHIGDFVLGFPAYTLLKEAFSKAQITLLCGTWNRTLAEASGLFDCVLSLNLMPEISGDCTKQIYFDEAVFSSLNLRDFDIAIDFRDSHETRFLLNRVRAKFRAGFCAETVLPYMDLAFPSATFQLAASKQTHHQTLQTLLAAAVIAAHRDQRLMHSTLQGIAQHEQAAPVRRHGKGRIIGVNIGSGTKEKNWPLDRFIALGLRLIKEQDATLVLFGSKLQETESNILANALPSRNVLNLVSKLALPECMATIQKLDAYIGNDTGTTHIAAALNVPTVCLFSGWTTHESHGAKGKKCVSIIANKEHGIASIRVDDVICALPKFYGATRTEQSLHGDVNLIVINNKSYASDFRKYLMRAAALSKADAVHLCCWAETTVTVNEQRFDKYSSEIPAAIITEDLVRLLGQKKTIIMVGLGLDAGRMPLIQSLRTSFEDATVLYDVYDYFRYDAEGDVFQNRLDTDKEWRRVCDRILILEKGLRWLYPWARHLNNASHMRRVPEVATSQPHRLVYIGSIDRRVDFEWLAALASHEVTLDIYGRVHEAEPEIGDHLKELLGCHQNVIYHGAYDNDDLPAILGQYRIGLLPYKTKYTMTNHINPDKVYHYLNAGLEVIATPIPQTRRMTAYLHLVSHVKDILVALKSALTSPRNSSWPIECYTWEKRWQELRQYLDQTGR